MEPSVNVPFPANPSELYSIFYKLSQTVSTIANELSQATKEVRELTAMMRGNNLDTGLIIEHERIKNKIDYSNEKSINDRLCEIERIISAGKWLFAIIITTSVINVLSFIGDLLTRLQGLPHP